ncbi:hypothetical protein [Streptomyces swartbergensis]|nr:hypothetical protein [Streptomyces swartbergensis]
MLKEAMIVAAAAASAIDMPTTAAAPALAGGPAVAMGQGEER